MAATCEEALRLGLPAVAFTEHCDFVSIHEQQAPLDVDGYLDAVERCRDRFPRLRILSGAELGEPHLFPAETAAVLASGRLERILGSVHCVSFEGRLMDLSAMKSVAQERLPDLLRVHLAETLALVESSVEFVSLAHIDYPKRYWPHDRVAYAEADYEEEFRAVLRALAQRGSALEVNTTRGADPTRGLCPGPLVLGWWREEGGRAVSFGSDAHDPSKVAAGFRLAAEMVASAGFRPAADLTAFWLR